MKKMFSLLLAAVLTGGIVAAQNPMDAVKTVGGESMSAMSFSSVMTDLTSNIKSSSFTPTFKKSMDDYLGSLKSMNPSDMAAAGTSVVQLAGGLKSTSFLNGWTPPMDMMNSLKKATSLEQIAPMASTLVSNLDPKIFEKDFDPATITSALGMLGGMK
ncbi:MAG: hypothetical protein IPO83_10480 [Chitinophagaceae bacterium]|nr:hypothetical protein [Chitinophagaceae bacterium]